VGLQFRLKEGSDKRWFNPNRDISWLLPIMLKKALISFDDFKGADGCTREQLIETAGALGRLFTHIVKDPVPPEETQTELLRIQRECPVAFQLVANRMFHVMLGVYTAFVADAKPKAGTDAEIPTVGLEEIVDQLAKRAATVDGSK
jgi:hypothetical protein